MTVRASSPAGYTITGPDEAKIGDTVNYKLIVDEGTLFSDFSEYFLEYDATKLDYVSFNSSYGLTFQESNKQIIFPSGGLQVTVGQEIGTLYFKVLANEVGSTVKLGDKNIKIIETPKSNDDPISNDDTNNKNDNVSDNNNNNNQETTNSNDNLKFYIVIACMGAVILTLCVTLIIVTKNKTQKI
jgi:hypothetical protein